MSNQRSMLAGVEQRSHRGTVEVRTSPAGGPVIFGYFSVFNRDSADMGFVEQVDPAAFNRTMTQADVRGLGNHDANWLLGRSKSGTLRMGTDTIGGWYEIDVNEADPDGQRALAKVQRGDWDGSSFSFQTIRDEWNWQTTPPQRRLLEVGLVDVGPVTYPAYPDASAASRALEPIAAKVGRPVEDLVTALKRGEIRSLIGGDVKAKTTEGRAVWSASYINDLPDSAFLYIEDGGEKDSDGKTTPRRLRHFPYKDADGKVDLPHLRNALARIPQSSLPQSVKDDATAKAEKLLKANTDSKNSLRALAPAQGTVMWGAEDGFCDLLSDVNEQLGYGQFAVDASVRLDKVLIADWDGDCCYVAEITVDGATGEPTVAASSEWVAVEQGWLVSDDGMERALALVTEARAGKVLSQKNLDLLNGIVEQLRDLMKTALNEEPIDSDVSAGEGTARSLSLASAELELRQRLVSAEAA